MGELCNFWNDAQMRRNLLYVAGFSNGSIAITMTVISSKSSHYKHLSGIRALPACVQLCLSVYGNVYSRLINQLINIRLLSGMTPAFGIKAFKVNDIQVRLSSLRSCY